MAKYYYFFSEGSTINQLICAVLINLPLFAYGASIGWLSPMTLLLQSKDSPTGRPLTDSEISWMASAAYLMCCPADFFMAFLGDRIGRKLSLLFVTSALVGCWVIKLASLQISAFIIARVLVGVNMAGCFVICPIYTKEISQDSIRGFLGSMLVLFQTSGNLFGYIMGDLLSYSTFLWVCLALPTVHLILFMMMPESPSFLLKRGNVEEATRVLAWLRCRDETDIEIKNEIDVMKKEQEKDMEGSTFLLKNILSDRILCRAFIIAMIVTEAREVCGAIPVLSFAGDIFSMASKGSSLVLTPNQQAMMLGAVQVAGSALASSVVEKAGRKMLLVITTLVSGLSMCCLASWFLIRDMGSFAPAWIPIVTLCVCIFCDASGLQPVSMVLVGEIVSFKYRGTVMAVTMAGASFSAFLQMLFFKPLATAIGVHVAFYFFFAICISAAVYVLVFVPETRNKTLDQIYDALKTKKEKAKEKQLTKSESC
ncbi:unnamed protein product [Chilo suppressalis]|uniref:Major facilitator superfamily (MFS) profile domain-containing protein n=1 Tax=Chilo suppressalis TaxID=168631 RepID=A0ABN8B4Q4_CHISP|nr:hypothetical protein evm_003181 [Chilo suppressalis]CAH0403093.1 unnamed protein product [Chilo suppressalis]